MAKNIEFSPAITKKASEAIFDQIRGMILSGNLKPGDKLPSERMLMEMLQRSRPTIREGLRMLENAGLIRIIPGGGAVVEELTANTMKQPLENLIALQSVSSAEFMEYRLLNETAMAAWAAQRRTDADIAEMRDFLDTADPEEEETAHIIYRNIQFHRLVAQASHNRIAAVVQSVIHQLSTNVFSYGNSIGNESDAGHRRIFDAIEKQDAELARTAMREHLEYYAADILVKGFEDRK